jgi:signal transduction histidine kinase
MPARPAATDAAVAADVQDGRQCRLAIQALSNAYVASALLHEIKAPLNNLKLTFALCDASLERAPEGAIPAELRARMQRYFRVASDEATRLAALLEELRQLSAADEEPVAACMLDELAADLARVVRHEATVRGVRFGVHAPDSRLRVRARRRALLFALLGIVIQLVERTGDAGEVRVLLARGGAGDAVITLDSTAASASEAMRRALASRGAEGRPGEESLAAAWACVEALKGRIEISEADGRYGCRVVLPILGTASG